MCYIDNCGFHPRRERPGFSPRLVNRQRCNVGEIWKTMVPYHLVAPASESESFFTGRETVRAMRQVWSLLDKYEVFGPMYDDLI